MKNESKDTDQVLKAIFKEIRNSAIAAEEVSEKALEEKIERLLDGILFELGIKE
jgi:flagellar hook-basal body complex protein FliE